MVRAVKLNKPLVTSTPRSHHGHVAKRNKAITFATMVNESLIELHSVKGLIIKQLMVFIMDKYKVDLTPRSQGLIKKHVNALRELNYIINTTGTGFRGHFKLIDKKEFLKELTLKGKRKRNPL